VKFSRLLVVACVWAVAVCPSAQANDSFRFDSAHSTIAFKVRHLVGTAKGRFTRFSGTIEVDQEHPEQSSVIATIQAASIDTVNAKRDEHLRTEDFFDVRKFPEIRFKSRRVKQTGPNAGDIIGDLSMHGVTREISLHVQLLGAPDTIVKNSTTKWRVTTGPIKRSEFGVGQSLQARMIGDDVTVEIEIEAVRAR
jgi:polyisoprenoid-binding protein YceI